MSYRKHLMPSNISPSAAYEAIAVDSDMDTISRAKAIDGKICIRRSNGVEIYDDYVVPVEYLEQLPPAQPDIIRCRNCKFASGDSRICMKFDHSPIGELDFCAWAERRTDE